MVVIFALKIQIKNEPLCGFVFKCYAKRLLDMAKKICTCTCNLTRIILYLCPICFNQVKKILFCVTH